MKTAQPIFILGCQRSGTTMLASMLSRLEGCISLPESNFKFSLFDQASEAERLIKIKAEYTFRVWDVPLEKLSGDVESDYQVIIRNFVSKNYGEDQDVKAWVDHTNLNLKYCHRLGEAFPEAKFIHLIRDGRAAMASVMKLDWGPVDPLQAATWWTTAIARGLAAENSLGERIIRVKYEDILTNPDREMSSLTDFLGFGPESIINDPSFQVPGYSQKQHALVGHEPDPSRIDRWLQDLTRRQIALFEEKTGDLLPALGYGLKANAKNIKMGVVERLKMQANRLYRFYFLDKRRARKRRERALTDEK